eukprot:g29768.t1
MEFVPLHGTVSTVKEDRGFGFIEVEGRSRDLYFKLHSLVHGLVPARGDRVKVFTRADRKGDEYVYRVELTQLASKRSRWREALRIMDDWRQKMQSDSTSQNALLEASSCLAVWRAVSELLTKAMHPQWDALAPEQPEATEKEEERHRHAMDRQGEYFDTYFRLLREDCISAIRHSIAYVREHGLGRNGPKQEREADDNVFRATLKGFTVGKGDGADSRIKVVFEVKPMFSSKRWIFRSLRFFMNGNLLACVCDQDFSDPIWLLAARRDLKHSESSATKTLPMPGRV